MNTTRNNNPAPDEGAFSCPGGRDMDDKVTPRMIAACARGLALQEALAAVKGTENAVALMRLIVEADDEFKAASEAQDNEPKSDDDMVRVCVPRGSVIHTFWADGIIIDCEGGETRRDWGSMNLGQTRLTLNNSLPGHFGAYRVHFIAEPAEEAR